MMDDEALDYGSRSVTPATPTPASESNDGTTDTARPSEKMSQARESSLPRTDTVDKGESVEDSAPDAELTPDAVCEKENNAAAEQTESEQRDAALM